MTQPALYDAVVAHSRRAPIRNRFRYRTYYWLVDIDQPPRMPRGLHWLARFDDDDHLDVRRMLADQGIVADRVLMLAHARTLGYVFNPLTLFWCYRAGVPTPTVVAEVHNTYGGRHAYVLDRDDSGRACTGKALYVSPFNQADGDYELNVSDPGEHLSASVTLRRPDNPPFVATLTARRRPATLRTVSRMSVRYPWTPLRTSALIRWQGVKLWARGLEVQPR